MGGQGDVWHMRGAGRTCRMNPMMNPLLAVHVAAGSVALASMFVPMVAHKGGTTHRRAGWVFVGAMAIVSVTAFVLAGSRFLFDPSPEGRIGGLFLLFVGLLTASAVSTGVRVLRFKNRTAAHLHWWDTSLPALLAIASVGIGLYGLVLGEALFIGFSVIGALNAAGSLRYWLRAPSSRTHWWFEHMTSMLGGCIAATTAFMVNTADNFGLWPLAAWLAPSIIGAPAIVIWTAYYRKQFSYRKQFLGSELAGTSGTAARSDPNRSRIAREVAALVVLALVVFSPAAVSLLAQGPQVPQGLPDLVGALKSTPGCLGVETARTSSGKQVIFAWFENKQAVLNWYYSDVHRGAMQMFAPGGSTGRTPLEQIADDSGPILAIASLTLVDKPQVEGVQLPVSQIAIELYAPLPGGLAAGGRFAPSGVKVPGLIEAPAR